MVYHELISFPCINPTSYLGIVLIKLLLLLFVFYCQDSFCSVPIVILMKSSISTSVDLWNTEEMTVRNYERISSKPGT